MSESEHTPDSRRQSTDETPTLAARLRAVAAWLGALPGLLWQRLRRIGPRVRMLRREHKAGNFPESNRRIIQFFLMLVGLFPMWHAMLRERFLRRRGNQAHAAAPVRLRPHPVVFVAAALTLAAAAAYFSLYTPATTVFYQGEALETLPDGAQARQITAEVEQLTADALGESFTLADGTVTYTSGLVRRSELGDPAALRQELSDAIGLVTRGYSLYIDGELVGSTQYEGALEALLAQLQGSSTSADTLSVDFVEDVEIVAGDIPTEKLVNLGYIAEIINSTKVGEETYTVVKGDTWSQISARNDMSNSELLALNPGYDIDRINIGDVLVLRKEVPYLTVKVTERQNYIEDVLYEVIYQDDSSMYQGDTKVLVQGEYGSADVVADVVYVNGVETEREEISRVMLTEPKPETRARGTKERPSWLPTGNFRWPCSGRITSYFGYRNTGIRGASTYHQGIDIACAYGTTIVASDGGTVEYTGYKGAMGYTVIIDHGNGYKTYYEHCKSFACSAGQHVYKGQVIAYVGLSGVTSGAHCHFGIMKNGSYVNPMRYLS
ncbi:MAG: peptidoglycan DD-metalloendopeptidase family protein [Oscillospiraceae bacterium]|nr:peptidoglycan DD-metalloendopeptidase family protein [Oscillospiraceae bacterium]